MGQMIVTYNGAEEMGQLIHFLEGIGFYNVQKLTDDSSAGCAPAICVDIQAWTFFGVSAAYAGCQKPKKDVWTAEQFLASCA